MKIEIKIPSMGESISEAAIGQIIAPSGTIVKADAEILEMETDKVNQVLYAPQAGKVTLNVQSGESVKIGQTVGFIEPVEGAAVQEKAVSAAPAPVPPPEKKENRETEQSVPKEKSEKASPPLQQKGQTVRLTKEVFLSELREPSESLSKEVQKSPTKSVSSAEGQERETRRPLSKIRRVIAHRLVEAQQTMAMLTTFNEVDLTQLIFVREKYKESFAKKYGCKLGFMSFFVKAAVSALQKYPDINSYIDGDEIVHREYYDIGVAVGTEKGVIVPILRNSNQLNFAEIEKEIESFAKKAREGKLLATDLQGGGFTITNGGIYGSLLSTPILLPPQCGILGMHKIEKRPVVIDNQIVIRSMMYLALSYDHRLIDGKEAVSFLVHIKDILEDPSRLLLEI